MAEFMGEKSRVVNRPCICLPGFAPEPTPLSSHEMACTEVAGLSIFQCAQLPTACCSSMSCCQSVASVCLYCRSWLRCFRIAGRSACEKVLPAACYWLAVLTALAQAGDYFTDEKASGCWSPEALYSSSLRVRCVFRWHRSFGASGAGGQSMHQNGNAAMGQNLLGFAAQQNAAQAFAAM